MSNSILTYYILLHLISKQAIRFLWKLNSSELLGYSKSFLKNTLNLTKISPSPVLCCSLSISQSLCALYIWFSIFFILKPVISNIFPRRTQPVLIPVITDRQPEYEISWIVSRSLTVDFVYFHFLSFILFSFTF